jgi:hypothetical protein
LDCKESSTIPSGKVVKGAAGQSKGKAAFTECDIVHSALSGQSTDPEEPIGKQYEVEVTTIDSSKSYSAQ